MWYWTTNIALSFLLCIILTRILIPQILGIAHRKYLFDEPDERKIHHAAIPRLGGVAFMPIIFLSITLIQGFSSLADSTEACSIFEKEFRSQAFLLSTNIILYLIGMADDLTGIRYRTKFIVQIFCGCCIIAAGVWIQNMHGLLGLHTLSPWLGYPLTVLVIVYIINAINLIDGIDGLASGLCSCTLLIYGITFFLLGEYFYSMLSFATLGVLIPFFYYNVYGNPEKGNKIFMGDTGSLTIGLMLSFLSIKLSSLDRESLICINPMIIAFSPLIIPCFDVVRVYLHRVRHKKNPFLPDQNHIHHKLLALGIPQHRVMMVVIFLSLLITITNILLSWVMDITLLLVIDLTVWTLGNMWLRKKINEKQKN